MDSHLAMRRDCSGRALAAFIATALLLAVGAVSLAPHAHAGRIHVAPGESEGTSDLATALAAAVPGDSLLLVPGLYKGTHVLRKGVSLIGVAGPDSTILDADGGRYILFGTGLDSTTVIAGLTLQNGRRDHANSGGGGIFLHRASPVIVNNVFRGHLGYLGPGVYANYWSNPIVAFNHFYDNEGYLGGAVAAYQDCAPLIANNVIYDNRAVSGGGILAFNSAPVIHGNTIVGNRSSSEGGGGALYCDSSPALVEYNVFAHNDGSGAVYWLDDDRPATLLCNIVWGNTGGAAGGACPEFVGIDGNRREDPEFADVEGRSLWRERQPTDDGCCVQIVGAIRWSGDVMPVLPDSLLVKWRVWIRDNMALGPTHAPRR